jgi:hypothetical protein
MITFSNLGNYGRLGNQLFQYAILLSIAERRGFTVKIPDFNNNVWHNQKCLLDNFNITAPKLGSTDKIKQVYVEPKNENFKYNPKIFEIQDNTDILGFFQNYRYYEGCEEVIFKELSLKKEVLEKIKIIYEKLKEKHSGYEIVSLHLRRGDSDLGMYGGNNLDENSKWYKYFELAKKEFEGKKIKFLVFTGGNRNGNVKDDYYWCSKNLKGSEFIFFDDVERNVIDDFGLMQLCDHHILSPISSFSWWVGYLNINKNKIIVAPEKYNFLVRKMDDDFYPPNFILK